MPILERISCSMISSHADTQLQFCLLKQQMGIDGFWILKLLVQHVQALGGLKFIASKQSVVLQATSQDSRVAVPLSAENVPAFSTKIILARCCMCIILM
ncbi:Hypothetical predicted protein [Podarcis lilfordi]|uniref:Uncharacterized protein n=1 Tax=Podarcis lilfordi TaxID=74358 RepID=A0AA35PFU0_9SAUR|nr:Hypothetical predicted protein [Podarcis lilfordi]